MNTVTPPDNRSRTPFGSPILWLAASLLLGGAAGGLAYGLFHSPVATLVSWILQLNSSQVTWYITRSAGLVAFVLLWLSTVSGLAITGKAANKFLAPAFTFDFHQVLSLLSLGFLALHLGSLLFDAYMPFSLVQILVPFVNDYRPVWVGLGVIAMYVCVLVTVTFYLRKRIGHKTFRTIHYASFLGYLMATFHGLFSGTDSALAVVRLIYVVMALVVVGLTVYRIRMARSKPRPAACAAARKPGTAGAAPRRTLDAGQPAA